MSSSLAPASVTRVTGGTSETQISTVNTILLGIYPAATTTGTVALKTGVAGASTALQTCAIGLLPAGKTFGPFGIVVPGLTVTLSQAADDVLVVWMTA